MPARSSFDYAIVRVVPRVERGEFLNVGAIVYARARRFLAARIALDSARLAALAPWLDPHDVQRHLDLLPRICAGDPSAGPIALLPLADRYHWLVAPRSAMIQTSPAHVGMCNDLPAALDDLMRRFVLPLPPTTTNDRQPPSDQS